MEYFKSPLTGEMVPTVESLAEYAVSLNPPKTAIPQDEAPMPAQPDPSPLEVALRLIESGKCPAIPTQARAAAFALIDAVRAEEARRAGK